MMLHNGPISWPPEQEGDHAIAACIYASDLDRPLGTRSKHIDTCVYRLRDLVRDKVLSLVKIVTGEQMADGLTRPRLCLPRCSRLCSAVGFRAQSVYADPCGL